jgi:two-component system response regulator YesN
MYSIIIADDEYFIRERLKVLLDYASLGYEIVCESADGLHAFNYIKKMQPDIAILDIKMPIITGIEIAKQIKELDLHTRCIILTSYEVFEYAQESLRYGVIEYLLKPVTASDLKRVLEQTHRIIEEKYKLLGKKREEEFLHCLMNNIQVSNTIPKTVAQLLGPQNILLLLKQKSLDIQRRQAERLYNIAASLHYPEKSFVFIYSNNIIGMLFCPPLNEQQFTEILRNIRRQTLQPINAGISNIFASASDLHNAFQLAEEALDSTICLGNNTEIYASSLQGINTPMFPLLGLREQILEGLRSNDPAVVTNLINRYLEILRVNYHSPRNLEALLTELILTSYIFLQENSINEKNTAKLEAHEILDANINIVDIERQIKTYYLDIFQQNPKLDDHAVQLDDKVRQIQRFIESNYSKKGLNLESVSEAISYSPNYVSTLFKKATGISVVQYITKCRMEAARLFIEHKKEKLAGISVSVGYTDEFYFSKCFKRYWGKPPSEFMQK